MRTSKLHRNRWQPSWRNEQADLQPNWTPAHHIAWHNHWSSRPLIWPPLHTCLWQVQQNTNQWRLITWQNWVLFEVKTIQLQTIFHLSWLSGRQCYSFEMLSLNYYICSRLNLLNQVGVQLSAHSSAGWMKINPVSRWIIVELYATFNVVFQYRTRTV